MTRNRAFQWVAVLATLAVIITLALVSPGFEAQEIPREDGSVWVTRASGQYARVNTHTAEIDTVRQADSASGVVQGHGMGVLLTQGFGRAWLLDPAQPQDLTENSAGPDADAESDESAPEGQTPTATSPASDSPPNNSVPTPQGTRTVEAAGQWVLYVTEAGNALLAQPDGTQLGAPQPIDPFAGQPVSAATIDDSGKVVLFSAPTGEIREYHAATQTFNGAARTIDGWHSPEPRTPLQLSTIAGHWVLYDPDHNEIWRAGHDPITVPTEGRAVLQRSTPAHAAAVGTPGTGADTALLADESGLWQIGDTAATRIATATGTPSAPALLKPSTQRATPEAVTGWLNQNSAQLWTNTTGTQPLTLDSTLDALTDPIPVLHTTGTHAVFADERSGMLWAVPDGTPIPLSQWSANDPPQHTATDTTTQQASEPEPPIAINDTFGVRAGTSSTLPVLINDYDPNPGDVLTIVTDTLGTDLDPNFGTVTALANAQELLVNTTAEATGSTTFTYQISDGIHTSAPATVTLNIATAEHNSAPEWCGVADCQRTWPSPEMIPGGTLVLPLLDGWVDPEGDQLRLAQAHLAPETEPTAHIMVTADGYLGVRHNDPNAPATELTLNVTVADSRGLSTERELNIRVHPNAAPVFAADALTLQVGHTATLEPLSRVSGGSGNYELIDAVSEHGTAQPNIRAATHTLEVQANEAGGSHLAVTVRDHETDAEITGTIRVTAVTDTPTIAVPPLRAFVRPQGDTLIDVLAAIPGADEHGLSVQSVLVSDGPLRADILGHTTLRIAHTAPATDTHTTHVGKVAFTLETADGSSAPGQLDVYAVPEADTTGVLARPDAVTVRASSLTDIPVLENDLTAPGETAVLHPNIDGAETDAGALAFASGSHLRYLAPRTPGQYTLTYSSYGASHPEQLDTATVRITVVGDGTNRAPHPHPLTVRVAAGETTQVTVPLFGIDPDGDQVHLIDVATGGRTSISAALATPSNRIDIRAAENAERGTHIVTYTVRDSNGAESTAELRVIVTAQPSERGAPIAFHDEVRLPLDPTLTATVHPTHNDYDPAGGALELISITPNLPGGTAHPDYTALASRIDTSDLASGNVQVSGTETPGTASYRYTVRSTVSTGTTDGTLTVHSTSRVGAVAPQIEDTTLTAGQRNELTGPGVDVLTDRVTWPGGDTNSLTLSLWGDAAEQYRVTGNRISGTYQPNGDTVPFVVHGVDPAGAEIESYGFLVIPALDDLRVTGHPGLAPLSVHEEATVTTSLRDLVTAGAGDTLELETTPYAVHRTQASCTGTNTAGSTGSTVSYQAGREAPWRDTCSVRVKLTEQTRYSTIMVPITVVPDEPTAELTALTRTIAPGDTETIELTDMLSWYGNRAGKLDTLTWAVDATAPGFDITRTGTTLTVTAHANASTGTPHTLPVRVTGAGDSTATLALRVGIAAPDTPRGATVTLRCTVGTNCETTLTGQPGEHDPFAGAPGAGLTLTSLDGSGCRVATLAAHDNRVRVTWPDDRGPGGLCTAQFTVRDAQQRTGVGTLEFDAPGVPPAPASITQIGYSANTVRLFVNSAQAAAYPGVTGVVIDQDGARTNANCTANGGGHSCIVSGLDTGNVHTFTARAVNTVGESDPTPNAVTAWAYETPAAPTATIEQISADSASTATLRFTIDAGDNGTGGYRITAGGRTHSVGNAATHEINDVPVGTTKWSVVPLSQYSVPAGDTADGTATTGETHVAGLPTLSTQLVSEPGTHRVQIQLTVDPNGGTQPRTGVASGAPGTTLSCTPTQNGAAHTSEITGEAHRTLQIVSCAQTEWGSAAPNSQLILVGGELTAPVVRSGYEINTTPQLIAGNHEYTLRTPPAIDTLADTQIEYEINGVIVGETFPESLNPEQQATVRVRYIGAESTSPWAIVPGNVPGPVRITVPDCLTTTSTPETLRALISPHAQTAATPSYDGTTLSITWSGAYAALTAFTVGVQGCTDSPPEP